MTAFHEVEHNFHRDILQGTYGPINEKDSIEHEKRAIHHKELKDVLCDPLISVPNPTYHGKELVPTHPDNLVSRP